MTTLSWKTGTKKRRLMRRTTRRKPKRIKEIRSQGRCIMSYVKMIFT